MASSKKPFPTWVVLRVGERDGWKCHVDGIGYVPADPWEIDHDVPRAKLGAKAEYLPNLRLCHRSCNRDKAAA